MAIYTVGSFVKTLAGTNAVHTLSLPVSVLSDRTWFIANLAKDWIAAPTPVTAITFNGKSLGAGITEVGTRQIAQEGNFSSQAQVWRVLDADGPTVAGNYNVVITTPQAAQGTHYCAFEVSDANQGAIDAIQLFSSIANVSAGNSYSHTITTIAANALIIDFWGESASSSPIITPLAGQTQIGVNMFNSSGGGNISYLAKPVAGPQVMGQTTNVLSQRQAGITISIAPVGAPAPIGTGQGHVNDLKRAALTGRGFNTGSLQDDEIAWLLSVVTTTNGLTMNDLWFRYMIEQGQASTALPDMQNAWLGGLGYTGSVSDRWLAYWDAG